MFQKKISKEQLSKLPIKAFRGDTFLIDSYRKLQNALPYLHDNMILGFDTETKPTFKRGNYHSVALLQLAAKDKAFLIRLNKIGLPDEIIEILQNPDIKKVGVAIHDDIKALQRLKRFEAGGFIELQNFVKKYGIENFGLRKLTGLILDFKISKRQQLSNWENSVLTDAQILYAATDAWVSYEIYRKLKVKAVENPKVYADIENFGNN